jgi:hypothetical protein
MPTLALAALKYWKLIGFGILAMLLAVQTARLSHAKGDLETARINLNECREGRKQDRVEYERAQSEAKVKNEADVGRIEAEQEKINADAKSRFERDLARLRAGGLRKDLAPAPRDPGSPQASPVPEAPGGADAEKLCVPRSEIMRAAEGELRLNSLIDWINEQLGVQR